MIYNKTLHDYKNVCNSYLIYIVISAIAFLSISAFTYFHWNLKKDNTIIANINPGTETVIH